MPDTRYFGVGEESTFKTAVAAATWINAVRQNVVPEREWVEAETIENRAVTKRVTGRYLSRGTVDTIVEPENVFRLFKWLLGTVTSVGTGSPPAAPFTHTLKQGDDLKSFTARIGADSDERTLPGCVLENGAFECEAGPGEPALLRFQAGILSFAKETRSVLGSPSFSSLDPFVFRQCTLTLGAVIKSSQLRRFRLDYRNRWNPDAMYRFASEEGQGTLKVGGIECSGELVLVKDDAVQWDAMLAGTEFAVKLDFVGPSPYQLTFDLPKVVYTGDTVPQPERRENPLLLRAPFRARYDATEATVLKLTLKNNVASF